MEIIIQIDETTIFDSSTDLSVVVDPIDGIADIIREHIRKGQLVKVKITNSLGEVIQEANYNT